MLRQIKRKIKYHDTQLAKLNLNVNCDLPTVVLYSFEKRSYTYLLIIDVLPVAESPSTRTLRMESPDIKQKKKESQGMISFIIIITAMTQIL